MPNKKILIFIDWFLPGYKAGGPISSNANLIEHLQSEFQFYLITRDTDYCEIDPYNSIIPDSWNTLNNGAKVYYISNKNLSFGNIVRIVNSIDFDNVYINGLYSAYFSFFPLLWFKYFTSKEVIIAARGMASDHSFSSKKGKKKIFYFLGKILGLYNKTTFHATNQEELEQIRKNLGFKGTIKIAPNLPPKNSGVWEQKQKNIGSINIVSIARISDEKNTLFALQLLEKIKKGNLVFHLYGTIYNQAYWKECEAIIKRLPSTIKVEYKGTINKQEVNKVLNQAHFMLMPSLGENFGHAIMESLMAGCPVIISDRTPWRNLQNIENKPNGAESTSMIKVGWDLPLEKPELWIEALEKCAAMPQSEYDDMSNNAFNYAQSIVNNKEIREANRKLFFD
jgi:glycosyltransferase involved in cell wall biosynthesis